MIEKIADVKDKNIKAKKLPEKRPEVIEMRQVFNSGESHKSTFQGSVLPQ